MDKIKRVALLVGAVGLLAGLAFEAGAQAYPSRPLRMIVPLAAGGGTDILARLMAQKMSEMYSQPVVVENRPGGGTVIGAEIAAKSAPDGYTLYVSSPTIVINHGLHAKLPYDAIRDFAAVSQWVSFSNILVVHPSLPVNSVRELIAYAKARPGQINYASAGNGSTPHLGMELLKTMAGIDLVHLPYKGSAPAMADLLGGRVSLMLDAGATSTPQVKSGKLRALAVSGASRSPLNPDLPTIAETVPGYDSAVWIGLFVPASTPKDIVDKLYGSSSTILKLPEVRERLLGQEMEPIGSTPDQFSKQVRNDLDKWRSVIKTANVKVD
jgi:tripartite-type tricarboxylate transporter receptor subunit TctC